MKKPELLPCPFCKGEDCEVFANAIRCNKCGAQGPEIYVGNIPNALNRITGEK